MRKLHTTFRDAGRFLSQATAEREGVEKALSGHLDSDQFASAETQAKLTKLAKRLDTLAEELTPGWWGADLRQRLSPPPMLGGPPRPGPMVLRIGTAQLAKDVTFGVVAPLLGAGHITIESDGRNPRVAGLLRAAPFRVIAHCMPTTPLTVRTVDLAAAGTLYAPYQPLVAANVIEPTVTGPAELATLLDDAELHVRQVQQARSAGTPLTDLPTMLICGALPELSGGDLSRMLALAHAGPAANLHLVVAAPAPRQAWSHGGVRLDWSTHITVADDGWAKVDDPPGMARFSAHGRGLNAPVELDGDPHPATIGSVFSTLAEAHRQASVQSFKDLLPAEPWSSSSVDGLRTIIGRDGREPVEVAFDDVTPHWQIGGRSGSGKTVLLLIALYTLAARYSPDELRLYLLDFKEGVSFSEFTPTDTDPSWIPHARAVGVESDREYGVSMLAELTAEMDSRAKAMKQAGVTKLADLRTPHPNRAIPRIVCVIDEFHVLFEGNDATAKRAVALLEDLARKGRSYGIHLVLASQTVSGVEALATKRDSIFGQFPKRIALAGASGILEPENTAAASLEIGQAIINDAGGIRGRNRLIRFANAHAEAEAITALRHNLWQRKPEGNRPPSVFVGYAEQHIEDDPTFIDLAPGGRRRRLVVGRCVDVGLTTADFALDATPGRHLAVLGTSPVGADILYAASAGLSAQHEPGTAKFILASLAAVADTVIDDATALLTAAGHPTREIQLGDLSSVLRELADAEKPEYPHTYLMLFGADAASPLMAIKDGGRKPVDDLRSLLKLGPAKGVHVLGWWRGAKRFGEDIGGSSGREDVACLVALNIARTDLGTLLNDHTVPYEPRHNRALLVDRHDQRHRLIVPFVRPGRYDETTGSGW